MSTISVFLDNHKNIVFTAPDVPKLEVNDIVHSKDKFYKVNACFYDIDTGSRTYVVSEAHDFLNQTSESRPAGSRIKVS